MKNIPVLRDNALFGSLGEVIIIQNSFSVLYWVSFSCGVPARCRRAFVVIVDHCYSIARQRSAKVGWMIPAHISAKASAVTAPVQTAAKSMPALIAVFISVTLSPT